MEKDGQIDYSGYSFAELLQARNSIDAESYPINYERVCAAIDVLQGRAENPSQPQPATEPTQQEHKPAKKDGEVDYSNYSIEDLRGVEANIDKGRYPKSYANLQRAIASFSREEQLGSIGESIYASFWQRLGAYILDVLILVCLTPLIIWGGDQFRLFNLYWFIPGLLFMIWYEVDLVKRYGGTPGKLIMGIEITKLDGSAVGYREAFLRYSVLLALTVLGQTAGVIGALGLTEAEHLAMTWQERSVRILELSPAWFETVTTLSYVWIGSEFVVMLTNKHRRAIHDFMAGTVVLRTVPKVEELKS